MDGRKRHRRELAEAMMSVGDGRCEPSGLDRVRGALSSHWRQLGRLWSLVSQLSTALKFDETKISRINDTPGGATGVVAVCSVLLVRFLYVGKTVARQSTLELSYRLEKRGTRKKFHATSGRPSQFSRRHCKVHSGRFSTSTPLNTKHQHRSI